MSPSARNIPGTNPAMVSPVAQPQGSTIPTSSFRTEAADPTISVIVPVYKVEPYLQSCVDSILDQSFGDFELLLVDDGSPDRCPQICDEYARNDDRVRVFHRENGGLSAARNVGLDNMRGAYVAMVDSDDVLVSRDYLKILFEELVRSDAEMSLCESVEFEDEEDGLPENEGEYETFVLSGEEYAREEGEAHKFLLDHAHGKLYAAGLFEEARYCEGMLFEDIAIQHRLTFPCKRIVFVEAALYGYRMRKDGICVGAPFETRWQDMNRACQDRIDYYRSAGRPDLAKCAEQSMMKGLLDILLAAR